MGCTASTNTAVVTTKEVKGSKVVLDTKKPLPPIGFGSAPTEKPAESATVASQPMRSKVESLPALPPIKMGRVTSNVAFEITDDSTIDTAVKRAPPKRLKRLQPIQAALTAEQLAEKQRLAELKRNRIKQNIRLKSARAGKRRSVKSRKADEENVANADSDAAQMTADPLNKRTQQIANVPQAPLQQVGQAETANAVMTESVIRTGAPKRPSVSYRRRPSTPLEEHANDQSKFTARSDTAALADPDSTLNSQSLFSTRRVLTQPLNAPAAPDKQLEKLNSVLDDEAEEQNAPTHISRLGSAESGFISAAHSAQATGKKPLSESDIVAFGNRTETRSHTDNTAQLSQSLSQSQSISFALPPSYAGVNDSVLPDATLGAVRPPASLKNHGHVHDDDYDF